MITAASRLSLFRLPAMCLLLIFALTGCWIPASNENPETPVSMNLPTATFTPEPTATITPEPTETEEIVTEEFDSLAAETEESFFDEETETPEAGLTEVAQIDFTPEDPFFDDLNAGQLPTHEDPMIQAATDIVATVTQEVLDATATAESLYLIPTATDTPEVAIPTLTPTPEFGVGGFATSAPVLSGGQCTHVVRAGDNLFRLSLQYNVPIRDIAVASGVANPDLIIVGQTLTIPNCSGGTSGGGTTGGGSAGGITHVVEQGETLYQISVRYNVPIRNIAAANGIQNVNLIYFNQRLTIP